MFYSFTIIFRIYHLDTNLVKIALKSRGIRIISLMMVFQVLQNNIDVPENISRPWNIVRILKKIHWKNVRGESEGDVGNNAIHT